MSTWRRAYLSRTVKDAEKSFATHIITKRSEGRWLLQRIHKDGRPEWTFAAEVIALENNALFVGGDIDHVVFAYGPPDPVRRVHWMGMCNDLEYYVEQKAKIGSANGARTERWVADVMKEELEAFRQQLREEEFDDEDVDDYAYQEALNSYEQSEFLNAATEAFSKIPDAWESYGGMGLVLSPTIIYAHAALKRLSTILRDEDASHQP